MNILDNTIKDLIDLGLSRNEIFDAIDDIQYTVLDIKKSLKRLGVKK